MSYINHCIADSAQCQLCMSLKKSYNNYTLSYYSGSHDRKFLDACLSHTLDIRLSDGRLSLIDEQQYVMTLDYLVKMLNVHERCMCGVPVIINGETGVGKTFLLQMLSLLWNQSILSAFNREKSRLQDILEQKLQRIIFFGNEDLEKFWIDPEEWFEFSSSPNKQYTEEHIRHAKGVVDALKNKRKLDVQSLSKVLILPDPQRPRQSLSEFLSSQLLARQYDPLYSLVTLPNEMDGSKSIWSLFQQLKSTSKSDVRICICQ